MFSFSLCAFSYYNKKLLFHLPEKQVKEHQNPALCVFNTCNQQPDLPDFMDRCGVCYSQPDGISKLYNHVIFDYTNIKIWQRKEVGWI